MESIVEAISEERMSIAIANKCGLYWGLRKPLFLKELLNVAQAQRLDFIVAHLLDYSNPPFSKKELTNFFRKQLLLGLTNIKTLQKYKSGIYEKGCEIILFRAEYGLLGKDDSFMNKVSMGVSIDQDESLYYGWDEVFKAPIKTFLIPSDHFEIVSPPHIDLIAETLRKELDVTMRGTKSPFKEKKKKLFL